MPRIGATEQQRGTIHIADAVDWRRPVWPGSIYKAAGRAHGWLGGEFGKIDEEHC